MVLAPSTFGLWVATSCIRRKKRRLLEKANWQHNGQVSCRGTGRTDARNGSARHRGSYPGLSIHPADHTPADP
jgi:hypothetical protein